MRRSRLLLLPAIVFALFLTSCRDRSSPTKPGTEPSYGKYEGDQDAAAVRIQALIEALYPEPGLEKAALNIWSNIQRLVSRELTDAASDQARALAGHLSDAFSQDQLEAPDDPLLPPTIEGAMSELLTRLYAFVGLEPSEALESYPDMLPQDFGAGDIDPEEGGTIVTAHGWAAVIAGTGATAEPVHITIELLDDAACDDVGELVRAVGCWDINWYPEDEEFEGFTDDVKVEACVADNPDMSDPEWNALLLHHKSDDGEVTALPWAEPTVVDCDGFTGGAEEETASLGPLGSWFASVRSHVADLLMPEPLAARVPFFGRMPKGIGGTTGTFSEFFGAVSRDLGQVLPEPLWDNLISWWPGNGTFDDIYGESPGHDDPEGSISFGTPAISGWAFQFGQGAGKVWMDTLSNEIEALQKLTLATWVYLDPNGPADRIQRFVSLGNEQAVLRQDMGGNRMLHFYMGFDEDGLVLHHVWVDNVLQPGCYHLVAGTYDGQDMRVYLDGEEVGSEPVPNGTVSGASDWAKLGSYPIERLWGALDEVMVFHGALSAGEIQSIWEHPTGGAAKCAIQETYAVSGTVSSSTGPVPGVALSLVPESGPIMATITDAAGRYRFPLVPPGTYEVMANGYPPYVESLSFPIQVYRADVVRNILLPEVVVTNGDFELGSLAGWDSWGVKNWTATAVDDSGDWYARLDVGSDLPGGCATPRNRGFLEQRDVTMQKNRYLELDFLVPDPEPDDGESCPETAGVDFDHIAIELAVDPPGGGTALALANVVFDYMEPYGLTAYMDVSESGTPLATQILDLPVTSPMVAGPLVVEPSTTRPGWLHASLSLNTGDFDWLPDTFTARVTIRNYDDGITGKNLSVSVDNVQAHRYW